jgi:hypothetical protein
VNRALNAAPELQAIEHQELLVEQLEEEVSDAKEGNSLKPLADLRRELGAQRRKLDAMRGGAK